jgi:hypothetical protein
MKTLAQTLARLIARMRLTVAANDLAFMEARAPQALAAQRAHVRHLAARLHLLDGGAPAPVSADCIRARAERRLKERLL